MSMTVPRPRPSIPSDVDGIISDVLRQAYNAWAYGLVPVRQTLGKPPVRSTAVYLDDVESEGEKQ